MDYVEDFTEAFDINTLHAYLLNLEIFSFCLAQVLLLLIHFLILTLAQSSFDALKPSFLGHRDRTGN